MHWRVSNAKNGGTDYIGDAQTLSVSQAAQELWRKYIEDAAPKNKEVTWDYLRIEVWLDSGRIILFPATNPFRRRIEKSACQISCPDLLGSFNEMADSKSDDEFDVWHTQTVDKVVGLVSQAAKDVNLPDKLERSEVKILYYSYSGESGAIKEDILKK
jgi:hypothetical protein